jgi:hypothetical protein
MQEFLCENIIDYFNYRDLSLAFDVLVELDAIRYFGK